MSVRSSRTQTVWQIQTSETVWRCDLRMLGLDRGWLVQVFRGRYKFTEQRTESRESAIQWATEMRTRLEVPEESR
jgi:hypothetical protein